jgi:1-deoxy-D-xylulose-5-phosphate synthase
MTSPQPPFKPSALLADPAVLAELKKLDPERLALLAAEIRGEIIRVITQNGGHLASSLGAVELILALHAVFESPRDRFIFDVGHQAYAHKILTGRFSRFGTTRLAEGLSGFPRREESPHDSFNVGHSSTSISAALGLAVARDLAGEDRHVIAVIGDGALTGGMALEAMNHAGALQKKLLVVFNDNRMSISPNVGAISQYLSLKLTSPEHLQLRERVKGLLQKAMPRRGGRLIRRFQGAEEALKTFLVSPRSFLAAWGFKYLGPLDGHDLPKLIEALRHIRQLGRPVFLHLLTTKGKGHPPAEDNPLLFHGLGHAKAPARPAPQGIAPSLPAAPSYTEVFGRHLVQKAQKDPRIVAITAAMSQGTGLTEFFRAFPDRAFDVGIAEQHAVTFAAGLAVGGLKPVVAIYSTFLQRAFDQLYHDVALQGLPVLFAVDRAGLVGEDGATHHGSLDLSYLRLLPGFTVMAPKDEFEFIQMLDLGLSLDGPAAVRYPRGQGPGRLLAPSAPLELGRAELLESGADLTIVAIGHAVYPALEAARLLREEGLRAGVVNARFIKPFDAETVAKQAKASGKILAVEENVLLGGLGGAVAEALAPLGFPFRLQFLGLPDAPVPHAAQARQRESLGLTGPGVAAAAMALAKTPL